MARCVYRYARFRRFRLVNNERPIVMSRLRFNARLDALAGSDAPASYYCSLMGALSRDADT